MDNADKSGLLRGYTQLLFAEESYAIRGACFTVYNTLYSSHKEIIYQKALQIELEKKGLLVEREKQIPVYYAEKKVGVYTPDLIVNNKIIMELKAKPILHQDDVKQFWYYLKNSENLLGFLINFGNPNKLEIIRRVYDSKRRRLSA